MNKQELITQLRKLGSSAGPADPQMATPDNMAYWEAINEAIELANRLIESPPKWLDEPTDDGWYWIEWGDGGSGYIHDTDSPQIIYKDEGRWIISDPDTVHDEPLNGRRVSPISRRPE